MPVARRPTRVALPLVEEDESNCMHAYIQPLIRDIDRVIDCLLPLPLRLTSLYTNRDLIYSSIATSPFPILCSREEQT